MPTTTKKTSRPARARKPKTVPEPLDDETLARAAALRAEGSSWAATARAVNRDPDELKRLCEGAGGKFQALQARARSAVMLEGLAESMLTLRRLLRDEDGTTARRAAETLARVGMTFYRHRNRGKGKSGGHDPRARNLREADLEFVSWLAETTDEQLAALSDHFRRTHPEVFAQRGCKADEARREQSELFNADATSDG